MGDFQRIEDDAVKKWRPLLRRQFQLALGMKARQARDAASGHSPAIARNEAIEAGLSRDIAYAVEDLDG